MAQVYWLHLPEHDFSEGYIGVSEDAEKRFQKHKNWGIITSNIHVKNAFDKHGNKVKMVVIFEGERERCLELEKELRPHKNMGWNIEAGGRDPPRVDWTGKTHKPETIEKLREYGKNRSEEWREKQSKSQSGKRHSEETKAKMRESAKTRPAHTEEQCRKISEAMQKENHPLWGKKHSDEAREKMSKIKQENPNCWITNGIETKQVKKDSPLPNGWRLGRTYKRKATS